MEELNLIGVKCPLNFVKAKIKLDKMPASENLKIILDSQENCESVIKSLNTEGYESISILENTEDNFWEIIVKNLITKKLIN